MSNQRKGTVDLNARAAAQRAQQAQVGAPPHLQPGVTDTHAAGYAAGIEARRRGGLPKTNAPVAGGPPPAIPALEQPYQSGMTMAQQAEATRRQDSARHAHTSVAQAASAPGSIIAHDVQRQAPASAEHVASPADLELLPQDMLPPEAQKDPHYQQGSGSRMAMNQPHMAAKYGVVRNGKKLEPHQLVRSSMVGGQAPPGGRKPARAAGEIRRDLEAAMNAGQGASTPRPRGDELPGPVPPKHLPKNDQEAEAQARGSAAGNAGQSPMAPALTDVELMKRLASLDDLDFEQLRREMIKDILKNPKQREVVEERCPELDINDLIMNNVVRQRVPIIPGRFEPTFESMTGDVELVLKRLLVQESKSVAVTENYLLDKYAVMTTTAGVVAINGNPIPSMYDAQGEFQEDLFWEKFNWILKRPIHMLASLGIHYSWFEQRVRKLFKADEGKDG